MRLSHLASLPACLASLVYAAASNSYNEQLHLKPLPGGTLYAGFTFTATTPLSSYENQHYRYFPRALAQILQYTHTSELHLRFGLGRWDEESWGSRPRSGLREGGNGVELWAWLEGDGDAEADGRWSDLVNSLSGLFCASLNFIDSGKTVRPVMTFEPEGTLGHLQAPRKNGTGELQLLHGMLPHEVVCTENLTPFLKLLPCKGKAGISSLLDGHKVFDANWQTMAVDVRPVCSAPNDCLLEIEQTVDMVLDIERSMRPRDNPIPRPAPIEDIVCDEEKFFNAQDTCYPKPMQGAIEWSLSRIFGRPIKGSCSLGKEGGRVSHDVRLDIPLNRTVEVIIHPHSLEGGSNDGLAGSGLSRSYLLSEGKDFDLNLPQIHDFDQQTLTMAQPPLYATRRITGYGAERGGMHALLHNPHPYPQPIVYLESLPWFLRPYIHTLKVDGGKIERMYYTPLLDRERGTHLELLIEIPALSTVELSYDFEKAILRYTEYPPDANRGFDVPAAVIRVLPSNQTTTSSDADGQGAYLRTTSLLLPLPTPDFSMPYNVIILTSTVIALGFGSVFNLLVRRFVLVDEVPVSPVQTVVEKVKEGFAKLRARAKGPGGDGDVKENARAKLKARVESAGGDEKIQENRRTNTVNGTPKERRKKER